MSFRITVDNNFFDNYETHPNTEVKEQIRVLFKNRKLSFYPSLHLLAELLGIYKTKRRKLLSRYAEMFFGMMGHRFFNDWARIIESELGFNLNERTFLDSRDVAYFKKVLKDLSEGEVHENLDNTLKQIEIEKNRSFQRFKESQNNHFNIIKKKKIKIPKTTFNDFYNMNFAIKIRKDLIKDLANSAGFNISDKKINKILDNKESYPYFYASSRIFMGQFYRHNVLKRRVSKGDSYDQYQLVYLAKLDGLVSNDKGMKELSEIVFGPEKKVITFDDLVKMVM